MFKQLLALFILTAIIGCDGNSRNDGSPSVITDNDSAMVAHGYDVVQLDKMKSGHITATFKVNEKPCVFLVDTGGGGTLIDISKKDKYSLEVTGEREYAAGIGSISSLVRSSATLKIGGKDFKSNDLFLMDISYLNAEFKKTKGRQVDGVLGTDFLEKHHAIIDYPHSKMYLFIKPDGEEPKRH